jgi:hypothetical protein
MGIFVVFCVGNVAAVRRALQKILPENHLEVADGQFLVASQGTAMDLSNRLGITDGENGSAIVFTMGSYYGRASTNIWDWIKSKAESTNG